MIKLMYFDEPNPEFAPSYDRPKIYIIGLMAALNSPLSLFLISFLVGAAAYAAGNFGG